jgi:putative flippase GtrA
VASLRRAVLLARPQGRGSGLNALSLPPVRFILVGIANTVTGLAVIYALKFVFGIHDVLANLLGYAVGLCVSYLLNARWTFSFRGSLASRAPHYALVIAVAYLVNLAAVSCALYGLHLNSYLAQAVGVPLYALVTYFGSKLFVFAGRGTPSGTRAAPNSVR